MTDERERGSWGVQHVAGFLASVAEAPGPEAMGTCAAECLSAALDADVCAIVVDGRVEALVGPPDADPTAVVSAATAGREVAVEVPDGGTLRLVRVEVGEGSPRTVVVGRRAGPLDAAERDLVGAIVQALELTLALHGAAERERTLRHDLEHQTAELRLVNERLSDALRVKRDLVSMASHELRTPLVAMLGFATLLRQGWEDFDDGERDEYLTILDRHGRRMLRLVDDLLTVGRLEDDRIATRRVEVSLSELVREIVRDLGTRDIELRAPSGGDDRILVDVDHLSRILGNLVDNARKYGRPPVVVEVVCDDDQCGVDVVDAGPGVPDEFVPSLFERFTQVSTGMQRQGSGVGLGLAIVAGLAGENGGWAVYDREDGRTRFGVRFPRPGGRADRV